MKVFRTLLWWLALAALGALAWQLLAPDLGTVLVRWHGTTIATTVAFSLLTMRHITTNPAARHRSDRTSRVLHRGLGGTGGQLRRRRGGGWTIMDA